MSKHRPAAALWPIARALPLPDPKGCAVTEQTQRFFAANGVPDWIDAPAHRWISSDELMAGERVIIIQHGVEEYRLRVTAAGKLILTK